MSTETSQHRDKAQRTKLDFAIYGLFTTAAVVWVMVVGGCGYRLDVPSSCNFMFFVADFAFAVC